MFDFLNTARALSDENRVRILLALEGRELCVCQVIDMLGLAPSTVSKHLSILRQARLIHGRKDGRWMYYRLNTGGAPAAATEAIDWVIRSVRHDPRIRDDARRLDAILRQPEDVQCGP